MTKEKFALKRRLRERYSADRERVYEIAAEEIDRMKTTENKGEWIPVTERLPKDGQSVLFCDIDDDIMVGYHVIL